jgi:hypothetical protein
VVASVGDTAATAKVLRADGARTRTCEDLLIQLIGEVRCSNAVQCAARRILAVHIPVSISSYNTEVVWNACICFCSTFGDISSKGTKRVVGSYCWYSCP